MGISTIAELICPAPGGPVTTIAYSIPKVRSNLATDALLVLTGSLIVAGLAQLTIKLPFTPVPISGQTLGVLLVGASLGAVRGGAALLLYLAQGAIGLPFFAEGESGVSFLSASGATGGYLWGFVIAAVVVGWLAEKGWDRDAGRALGAMLIGEIIVFTLGVLWLAAALDIPVQASGPENDALEFGLYPFVLGDLIKLLIAAGVLPLAWRFVKGLDRKE